MTLPSLIRYDPYFDPADLSDPRVVEIRATIKWSLHNPESLARLTPWPHWSDIDYVVVQMAREEVGLAPDPERWWT